AAGKPAADLVSRATRALNTNADDLAWLAPRLPGSLFGPVQFTVNAGSLGSHRVQLLALNDGKLNIVPHRWRTVFDRSETATYQILSPRGSKTATAKVLLGVEGRREAVELGKLTLPGVEGRDYDSRLFTVRMGDLPSGKHHLWLESDGGKSGLV